MHSLAQATLLQPQDPSAALSPRLLWSGTRPHVRLTQCNTQTLTSRIPLSQSLSKATSSRRALAQGVGGVSWHPTERPFVPSLVTFSRRSP